MKKWWMEKIGYQIYPKSFYDSNNDGIGDINGIKQKLHYLNNLGIDLIWICPFYDSPMDDNGYDVRDFFNVAREFGTVNDFKELLKEAKKYDIKIILDLVLNHTSDEHKWFIESKSSSNNSKRDYYIWKDGKIVDGKELPPTNWGSFFGGSAWKKDSITNMYYMKIFSDKMPDLNWSNKELRLEMMSVAKWWLDLGIDGFRIDAVSHLDRAPFEDSRLGSGIVLDWNKFSNLPKVHEYLKEMNKEVFSKYDALTVGEVGGAASIDSALQYSGFNSKELSMVFNFDHNWCNNLNEINDYKDLRTNVIDLKHVFNKWQEAFKTEGWLPLNWLNHDQPRLMSQYGDQKFFKESAKMLATSLYLMRGTPFIYQGEEIGMTNYPFEKFEDFKDISSINYYKELKDISDTEKIFRVSKSSRDNARTPIQWDNSKYAGFSKVEPWININPNYHDINVLNNLEDSDSIFNHYKQIIKLRKTNNTLIYGTYKQLDLMNEKIYIYERESNNSLFLVINSFSNKDEEYDLENYYIDDVLLSNYKTTSFEKKILQLKPYESIVLKVRRK
ncbi:glycoside hydrolase family 13 protein [Haploplasma axanthum]|nr:alpha-glucosidase [Haploplasma axanthum]